jgi:hypothetical protein
MTRTRPHANDRKRHADRIAPRTSAGREPDARGGDGVRGSRVMTAQTRITAGYYQRADVQELVITAVLNELRRR